MSLTDISPGNYDGRDKPVSFSDFKTCFTSSDLCDGGLS